MADCSTTERHTMKNIFFQAKSDMMLLSVMVIDFHSDFYIEIGLIDRMEHPQICLNRITYLELKQSKTNLLRKTFYFMSTLLSKHLPSLKIFGIQTLLPPLIPKIVYPP